MLPTLRSANLLIERHTGSQQHVKGDAPESIDASVKR